MQVLGITDMVSGSAYNGYSSNDLRKKELLFTKLKTPRTLLQLTRPVKQPYCPRPILVSDSQIPLGYSKACIPQRVLILYVSWHPFVEDQWQTYV